MYRFKDVVQGEGTLTFLDLIWAANKAARENDELPLFGEPTKLGVQADREGRFIEEYPEAEVIGPLQHNNDGVRVVAKTERAARLLRAGAIAIGYPNVSDEEN